MIFPQIYLQYDKRKYLLFSNIRKSFSNIRNSFSNNKIIFLYLKIVRISDIKFHFLILENDLPNIKKMNF